MTKVAVVGAGITGLSAAWLLQKNGVDVVVYEKENCAGGVIQTYRQNGWLMEKGPHTMLVKEQRIWNLLDELGLKNHIQKPDGKAKKRYIVRSGKPVAVPMGFTDFLTTDLLSLPAKLRLLKEPFISAPQKEDETIADFIRRRLGPEPLDYAVNPFVSGIYAGDPKQLSIKHTFRSLYEKELQYGSIAKGFWKQKKASGSAKRALISFDEGLHRLPQTMAAKLGESLRLNTGVEQITATDDGWNIHCQTGESYQHRAVMSTIPAYKLPAVFKNTQSNALQYLAEINYAPMSVVALGFRRDQITHTLDGFGMLIPELEPFSLLGCLFSSSLFEHRAPDNHVLLTCFAGGARHPELAAQPTDELVKKIMPQLNQLLGVKGDPVFRRHQFWPQAIPQYTVGYDDFLQAMDEIESAKPGLFLGGSYRGGVSVPDCILNGFKMAEEITTH